MKRWLLLMGLLALVLVWHFSGLGDYLTFASLTSHRGDLARIYADHPATVLATFFLVYVLLTALSVPGATLMTLAAGAVFGLEIGFVLVSFASAIGATLAFLSSRYVLRETVQTRFGVRLRGINDGIARDGAFYLLTLRLAPVFPFFLVNLLMGLTPIRTWTFYWVSQIGMLLGTLVYVNAGTQLATIQGLGDVASPTLLGSFLALSLLPWVGKWLVGLIRQRRLYARWPRPRQFDRNLIVIGGGAAGLVSAYIAATVRAKVTLVEAGKMGGDCLNYGCVPSKALIRAARAAEEMRRADRFGIAPVEPKLDFPAVMRRVHGVIAEIEPHDSVERYTALGVDVVKGYARIIDPWTVEIARTDGTVQQLSSRAIVIAAGAEPFVPDLPGLETSGYQTSDTLWDAFARLDAIPRRIVVLGGGPIGCELAQALARLGAEVSQVERGTRLLPREDEDAAKVVMAAQEAAGVTVLTGHSAVSVDSSGDEKVLVTDADDGERRIPFDALIVAVGRKARLSGYGLEDLGIETTRTVVTDQWLATMYPNIYAAGDVAGPYQFTHTAAHQAWYASVNALFGQFRRFKADNRVIPWTTFTDPEVARVGINEQEAAAAGTPVEVTRYSLHELDRAIADGATEGFVKVLTAPGKDKILGVTIVGQHAGELLAEYVLAMKHGLGLNKLLSTIHTYPTMAEANKYAAGEWKRQHAPEWALALAQRYHAWRRG